MAPTNSQSPQPGISRLGSTPDKDSEPPATAPVPAPYDVAVPRAAPGNAQAQNIVEEDPGKDHLPVIVLGALLGAVTIALFAGRTALLIGICTAVHNAVSEWSHNLALFLLCVENRD